MKNERLKNVDYHFFGQQIGQTERTDRRNVTETNRSKT